MKFITFYFSGTGNTKWTCENFNRLLKENNHESFVCSIEKIKNDKEILELLNGVEYLGFAYPIYLQNIPRIMIKFINNISDLIKRDKINIKHVFFINTYAYTNASGVFRAKHLLKISDVTIIGYVNIKLSDNTKSNININPNTGESMTKYTKEQAVSKLNTFIKKVENNKKYINGINPNIIIGSILSKVFKNVLINNYKKMRVDMNICINCMECVQNCPAKCITFVDNTFVFSRKCEVCMRCIYNCKVQAISNKTIK